MVIEATFLERDAAMAFDYGHLTAAKSAELAAAAGVRRLVLTHISGRYTDEEILAEAQKYSRTPEWRLTSIDWRSEALPTMSTKEHVEWLRS